MLMLLWNGTSIGVPRPCKFWYRQRAWVVYFLFIGKRAGGGVNQDGSLNSVGNPEVKGSIVVCGRRGEEWKRYP